MVDKELEEFSPEAEVKAAPEVAEKGVRVARAVLCRRNRNNGDITDRSRGRPSPDWENGYMVGKKFLLGEPQSADNGSVPAPKAKKKAKAKKASPRAPVAAPTDAVAKVKLPKAEKRHEKSVDLNQATQTYLKSVEAVTEQYIAGARNLVDGVLMVGLDEIKKNLASSINETLQRVFRGNEK